MSADGTSGGRPASSWRRVRIPPWLRVAVGLSLLLLVTLQVDWNRFAAVIAAARFELLALVALNFGVERMLSAFRLRTLLRVAPRPPSYWKVLRVVLVSHFLGFFLPGSAGVNLLLMHGLTRSTASLWLAVSAVLVERTLGIVAVIMLVLLGVSLASQELPDTIARTAALALVALAAGTLGLMHRRSRSVILGLARPVALAPIANAARSLFERLDAFAGRLPLLVWSAALAVAFQLLRVSHVAIASWGFGANLAAIDFLIIVPVAFFAAMLPISIAGLGVREVAYVYLFGLFGVEAEVAVSVALFLLTLNLLYLVPGAALYTTGIGRYIEPIAGERQPP